MEYFDINFNEYFFNNRNLYNLCEEHVINSIIHKIITKSFNRPLNENEEQYLIQLIDFYTKNSKSKNKEETENKLKFLSLILDVYRKSNYYNISDLESPTKNKIINNIKLMYEWNILGLLTPRQKEVLFWIIKKTVFSKLCYAYKIDSFSKRAFNKFRDELELYKEIYRKYTKSTNTKFNSRRD